MKPTVPDDGRLSAKLVLIGEAPGKWEMLKGKPFVGPSGNRLECWWRSVGLTRRDFYITNVVPYQPESIGKVPVDEMKGHIEALHARLDRLEEPWVIVPTGNYALYALTGKGKVSWHRKDGRHERPGILDWRGSILTYNHRGQHAVKVIPTIHPAHILRTPGLERKALKDWARIAEEAQTRDLRLPVPDLHIKPTLEDVESFVQLVLSNQAVPLALDIETPKGRVTEFQTEDGWKGNLKKSDEALVLKYKSGKKKGLMKTRTRVGAPYIGCIGFGISSQYAICVPLTLAYWKSREKLERVKELVAKLLAGQNPKVMQNGMFDTAWLRHEGYEVTNWLYDTRAMHHALDPRDDHDLAYMASTLTRFPFWKHEAKDPEEITKYASNSEALWTYNCLDVVATMEIYNVLLAKLRAEGLLAFYFRHYADLIPPILDMTLHGVRTDEVRMTLERGRLDSESKFIEGKLEGHAGMPLVAKKAISNDRLKFLFYGAAGFPGEKESLKFGKLQEAFPLVVPFNFKPLTKKNTKGDRSITVDEVAIRRLILKYPDKLSAIGPLLLDHRRNRKMAEFVDTKILDPDGRMRCMYSFVTDAGRLASSSTPWNTGRNLQNIDRELRYVFVPDLEEDK